MARDSSPESGEETGSRKVILGKYRLGRVLGYGAVGKVYHAQNIHTGETVAIKAVSRNMVVAGGMVEHIKREISNAGSRLRHRHVIRLYEVLATKTKIYMVMEYARGGDLLAQARRGRFSDDLSRRYFQQLISAAGYCHSRGVFHRDLKPENLLLDENWDLKVADFGFSAVAEQIQPNGLLHTLCGTPAYVAPEILSQRGYDGAKADIWSIGVILYALTTGSLPFFDENVMELYRKIYRGKFKCPSWISPDLEDLLSRLMDTNPETRISIEEIECHPWFTGGISKEKIELCRAVEKLESDQSTNMDEKFRFMNAFDLIANSSGCDLSGLFEGSAARGGGERFILKSTPEEILERLEQSAKEAAVERNGWMVRVEGKSEKGRFGVNVDVRRLTENLAVVEVAETKDDDSGLGLEFWNSNMRPNIIGLIVQNWPISSL